MDMGRAMVTVTPGITTAGTRLTRPMDTARWSVRHTRIMAGRFFLVGVTRGVVLCGGGILIGGNVAKTLPALPPTALSVAGGGGCGFGGEKSSIHHFFPGRFASC